MDRECIVLAGGLGTRLRSELPDTPKVMAPVAGRPFLSYVLEWLQKNGVVRAILSLGYRSDEVKKYCRSYEGEIELVYSEESEPLGTGGAIALAVQKSKNKEIFIANGDTLFKTDLDLMEKRHRQKQADLTIALKPMEHFNRYGVVITDDDMRITGFEEKGYHDKGLINGGVYLLHKDCLNDLQMPDKFSFETDFLEVYYRKLGMYGFVKNAYFIDIGIPEDYRRAQEELSDSRV